VLKFLDEKRLSDVRPIEEAFSRDVLIFRYHLVPVMGKDLMRRSATATFKRFSSNVENSSQFVAVRTGTPILDLKSISLIYNPE
jgi:hypothetical protein